MKVTVLGTGSFVSDLDHLGPGYLLEINDKKILIDAGSGVQIQLIKLDIGIADLDYIFITHFHPDHTAELYSILVRRFLLGRFYDGQLKDLVVYGPKGVENFVREIARIHQLEIVDKFLKIRFKEITEEALETFSVKAFEVKHQVLHKNVDALALRFESDNKSVVFSGDTMKCEGIERAILNADIFIADCSISKDAPSGPHLRTNEIGEISSKQGIKKVILSHLLPRNYNKNLVGEVKEEFNGEVVLGKDLMEIEV